MRVINGTDTVGFASWFTAWFHLTQGKQRQLPLPQLQTEKQNPAYRDVALEVRFVSSESPHGQPHHWTMVLTMSLDSQLLKDSEGSYKKRCDARLAFYAFSSQTSATTVSDHNWQTKSALLSPARSSPHQMWYKQE